ncbi:MAG TPA: hypothetical protein VFA67_10825 [Candidatus Sulfotelmatobacter sp.]|nr:hypothetical protein [Candidatus Sulfotelmatobacter sp.]
MNASPSPERLEIQALQQREQIHRTALELISKVDDARERLTLSHNVRRHFAVTASIAAAFSFLCGYALAGMFTES